MTQPTEPTQPEPSARVECPCPKNGKRKGWDSRCPVHGCPSKPRPKEATHAR